MAQEGATEETISRARALFRAGVAAFEAGDISAALRAFQESYELHPHPETVYNIAGINARLGRYRQAVADYEQYLSLDPNVPAERRAAVAAEIDRLRDLLVRLSIEVTPAGSVVSVNGIEVGSAPLDGPVLVDPGTHVVEARREGYRAGRAETVAAPGATLVVRLDLQPLPALVTVGGLPAGATVELDGVVVGRDVSPSLEVEVAPGRHVVRVSAAGYEPAERTFEAAPGAAFRIDLSLVPIVPARFRILGHEEASVWIDGELRGPIPWEGSLEPGTYDVVVEGPGLHRWEGSVSLRSGDVIDVDVKLGRLPSGPHPGWVWGFAGAAAAAGIVSLGLGLASLDSDHDFDQIAAAIEARDYATTDDLGRLQAEGRAAASDARNLALACDIAWGVAAAAAATAGILLLLVDEGEEGPSVTFSSAPTTAGGLVWRW